MVCFFSQRVIEEKKEQDKNKRFSAKFKGKHFSFWTGQDCKT